MQRRESGRRDLLGVDAELVDGRLDAGEVPDLVADHVRPDDAVPLEDRDEPVPSDLGGGQQSSRQRVDLLLALADPQRHQLPIGAAARQQPPRVAGEGREPQRRGRALRLRRRAQISAQQPDAVSPVRQRQLGGEPVQLDTHGSGACVVPRRLGGGEAARRAQQGTAQQPQLVGRACPLLDVGPVRPGGAAGVEESRDARGMPGAGLVAEDTEQQFRFVAQQHDESGELHQPCRAELVGPGVDEDGGLALPMRLDELRCRVEQLAGHGSAEELVREVLGQRPLRHQDPLGFASRADTAEPVGFAVVRMCGRGGADEVVEVLEQRAERGGEIEVHCGQRRGPRPQRLRQCHLSSSGSAVRSGAGPVSTAPGRTASVSPGRECRSNPAGVDGTSVVGTSRPSSHPR